MIQLELDQRLVSAIISGLHIMMLLQAEAGMVPSSLLMRIMVRLRVSAVWVRILAPRMRLRTLGSACAVFDGLQNSVHGATKIAL